MAERHCLNCGMSANAPRFELDQAPPLLRCAKCDQNLFLQHDGSCLTDDIAHHHETLPLALKKLDRLLLEGWRGYYRTLRVIIGGGLIREQTLGQLHYYQRQGLIRAYHQDSPNRGAVMVVLRD
ncbi:MAG: hypothetical protein LBE21_07485 [Pseudomonadales bacterium]|jgi:hypothetical protein|nr:hypothetical protein [Pseudomonadales bacterium]